jgi:hypothetical protein
MTGFLPSALEAEVRLGGRRHRLRPTVFHVMSAMEALKDELLTLEDRVRLAVWHLYRFPRPRPTQAALEAAFKLLEEGAASPYGSDPKQVQALDFQQDAGMLIAAFRQQYGMDLVRESAALDWREFLALVGGITDGTRLGEIMGIRTRELPRRTAHNGEQIRDLQRLKMIYRIREPRGGKKSFEEGLKGMVEVLAAMAGGLER